MCSIDTRLMKQTVEHAAVVLENSPEQFRVSQGACQAPVMTSSGTNISCNARTATCLWKLGKNRHTMGLLSSVV